MPIPIAPTKVFMPLLWLCFIDLHEQQVIPKIIGGSYYHKACRLKQCGRKYTLFKFLQSLGGEERQIRNTILYGGSWWHLSAKITCQRTMDKIWFARQGLHTLEGLYKRFNR